MNLIGKLFFAVRISQDFDQLSKFVVYFVGVNDNEIFLKIRMCRKFPLREKSTKERFVF